jgi:hypothetical protein
MNGIAAEAINRWFRTQDTDMYSPATSITEFRCAFQDYLASHRLQLNCTSATFSKSLCEALCVYYASEVGRSRRDVTGPHRQFPRSSDWTEELEAIWTEFLNWQIFSSDQWRSFWSHIPVRFWESEIPEWRSFFETFVLEYLKPDPDRLVKEGLLYQEGDDWVAPEDHISDGEEE